MEGPRVFLFLVLMAHTSIVMGLKMNQDVYHVTAEPLGMVELTCATQESPEKCSFTRPDGKVLCSTDDYEDYDSFGFFGSDDDDNDIKDDCVEDPSVIVKGVDFDECKVQITSIDSTRHFGDWTCTIEDFAGQSASAKISVGKVQPAVVDFETYFGTVGVDLGKEKEINLQCNAKPKERGAEPFSGPPGKLTFKVGGTILDGASEWKQTKKGQWYQTLRYEPDIWDDEKEVQCILKQGDKEVKSSAFTLNIFMFEEISEDSKETKNIADGEETAEFSITFQIYPSPDAEKMKWIIYDESEDESTEMRLGRKTDKYEANSLKSDGSQTYTVYLSMNNVKHEEDDDKIITFNVELENGETRVIELPFAVNPPVIESTPKPIVPPVNDNLGATSVRPELNMETTPKAKESGTSLIIIIVIVIFFVVLCVLFYLMKAGYLKCCKQPEPREEDPEAGKPLVHKTNSSDKSSPSQASEQQSNETDNAQGTTDQLKDTEKEYIKKLAGSMSDSSSESDKEQEENEEAANEDQPKSYADAVKESSNEEPQEEEKEETQEEPKEEVQEEPIEEVQVEPIEETKTEPIATQIEDESKDESKDEVKAEEDDYDENKEIQRMIHQLSLDTQEKVNELDNLVQEKSQMAVPFDTKEYLDRQQSNTSTKSADSTDGTKSKQTTFKEPERPKLEKQPTINRSRQSSISSWKDPRSSLTERELKEYEFESNPESATSVKRTPSMTIGTQTPSKAGGFSFKVKKDSSSSSSSSSSSDDEKSKKQ